jgi:hypothetical protein
MNSAKILVTAFCGFLFAETAFAGAVYKASQHRDPFQLPALFSGSAESSGEKKEQAVEWRLEGLIWGSDSPQAIVNGKIIEKGSRLGEAEVLQITEEGVRLKFQGKETLLRQTGKDTP